MWKLKTLKIKTNFWTSILHVSWLNKSRQVSSFIQLASCWAFNITENIDIFVIILSLSVSCFMMYLIWYMHYIYVIHLLAWRDHTRSSRSDVEKYLIPPMPCYKSNIVKEKGHNARCIAWRDLILTRSEGLKGSMNPVQVQSRGISAHVILVRKYTHISYIICSMVKQIL